MVSQKLLFVIKKKLNTTVQAWYTEFMPETAGIMLPFARITGETASLLFTSFNNSFSRTA
jgi:ABC-type phosphate transport system permease subunit